MNKAQQESQQRRQQLLQRLKAIVNLNRASRLKREQQARTIRTITR
jgi:hypothetical protein